MHAQACLVLQVSRLLRDTKYPRINMTSENVKNHHTGFPVTALICKQLKLHPSCAHKKRDGKTENGSSYMDWGTQGTERLAPHSLDSG